jgi:hypothetical protein
VDSQEVVELITTGRSTRREKAAAEPKAGVMR